MFFGARWARLSISEMADLLGFSGKSLEFTQKGNNSVCGNSLLKRVLRRKMARVRVQAARKAVVTYKTPVSKKAFQRTQNIKYCRGKDNNRRAHRVPLLSARNMNLRASQDKIR